MRRDVHEPGDVLPAGHRDRGVVEDLERDVDARRDTGADGERSRVAQRPVPEVLDEVRLGDEGREADPRHALRAHRCGREAVHAAVARLEVHDPVATDAAADERAGRERPSSGCAGTRCRTPERAREPARSAGASRSPAMARGASPAPACTRVRIGCNRRRVRARRPTMRARCRRDRACPRTGTGLRASWRMLRSWVSTNGRFSSTTSSSSTDAANSTTVSRTNG